MQYRQPMHLSYRTRTRPSVSLYVASTGHTGTHGGSSQCMQGRGNMWSRTFGYVPLSSEKNWFQKIARSLRTSTSPPIGTLFSIRHATMHAWHAVHLSRSITMPQRAMSRAPRGGDAHTSWGERGETAKQVVLVREDRVGVLPRALRPPPVRRVAELERDRDRVRR